MLIYICMYIYIYIYRAQYICVIAIFVKKLVHTNQFLLVKYYPSGIVALCQTEGMVINKRHQVYVDQNNTNFVTTTGLPYVISF